MEEIEKLTKQVAKLSTSEPAKRPLKAVKRKYKVTVRDAPPPSKCKRKSCTKQGESIEAPDWYLKKSQFYKELLIIKCINISNFRDSMFRTSFGKLVLLVRPWLGRWNNIRASCQACQIPVETTYENSIFTILLNKRVFSKCHGCNKRLAKRLAEYLAWVRMKSEVVIVFLKELGIAQGVERTGVCNSVLRNKINATFGTPIEGKVARVFLDIIMERSRIRRRAKSPGSGDPLLPNLQFVRRADLCIPVSTIQAVMDAVSSLMIQYISSSPLDVYLVFSPEFTTDERAAIHQCAQRHKLASKSYATGSDRFLVVRKILNLFSIAKTTILKGGNTAKYQVFLPKALGRKSGDKAARDDKHGVENLPIPHDLVFRFK